MLEGWGELGNGGEGGKKQALVCHGACACNQETHANAKLSHTHEKTTARGGLRFFVSTVKTNCSAIGVVPLATSAFGEAAGPLAHPPPGRPSPLPSPAPSTSASAAFPPWLGREHAQLNTTLDSDHQPPNVNPLDYQSFINPSAAEPSPCCFSAAYQSRTPLSSSSQLALIA